MNGVDPLDHFSIFTALKMSEAVNKKIRKLSVHRFADVGMDEFDPVTEIEDALKIREVDYDEHGKVLKETEFNEEGEPAEMFLRTYDEKGNILELQHYYEGELSETTHYGYNEALLPVKERLSYADGGVLITEYVYNSEGNVLEKKVCDSDGTVESIELNTYLGKQLISTEKFDGANVLKESRKLKWHPEKEDELSEELNIDHDAKTELRTVYLDNETGSITYNKEGKVHTRQKVMYDEKKRVTENIISTFSGNYNYTYGYDENDNVIEEIRTQGGTIFFKAMIRYNEAGSLSARSVTEMNSGLFTDVYSYEYHSS